MRAILVVFVLANAGCLRKTEFQCSDDSACGPNGRCEITNFCSFADPECSSGRRYDQSAGTLAGQCTGGGGTNDGGPVDTSGGGDTPMTDAPPLGCPAGYNPLTGGEGNHVYRLINVADDWTKQQAACRLTSASANLAVPAELGEHTALDTLAGVASYWVGITDSATENTWLNVQGMTQTYLPWQPPAPDNDAGGQGEDCVESLTATHTFNDRRCMENLVAICECVPP
ncbi:MAG TPA: lectin-like protein [Kofleriaceae bacterium]